MNSAISDQQDHHSVNQCLSLYVVTTVFLTTSGKGERLETSLVGGDYKLFLLLFAGSCRVRSTKGHCCVFPFIYKRRRYNGCTRRNSKRAWCSLTPSYDRDRKWSYCGGGGTFGSSQEGRCSISR